MKQKLPIGVQSFPEMIQDKFVYIDKTAGIYNLIKGGSYFFLSRPRRFGKSLLVSTLEQLFLGKRELFEGLDIAKTDYSWQEHPVITLRLASVSYENAEALKKGLSWKLQQIARRHGLDISCAPSVLEQFESLIYQLSQRGQVVVLIDEYDAPIIRNLHKSSVAAECRDVLSSFFSVLKDNADYIRFIFITGITKFAHTSIFSGLNSLQDLTVDPVAAELLGYTQKEIVHAFEHHLVHRENVDGLPVSQILDKLQFWYNGYQFSLDQNKPRMYNPYSVLLYLNSGFFLNYWFASGTPSFLHHLIATHHQQVYNVDGIRMHVRETVSAYKVDNPPFAPLLWQTGYLTIKAYDPQTNYLTLTYPNEEVKVSFLESFLNAFIKTEVPTIAHCKERLSKALLANDLEVFFNTLQVLFANIPYDVHISAEKYYQSLFYVILNILDIPAHVEVETNNGRIDSVIKTPDYTYLFEFKLNYSAEKALDQIIKKQYYQKYAQEDQELILVGASFNTSKRNIEAWHSISYKDLKSES